MSERGPREVRMGRPGNAGKPAFSSVKRGTFGRIMRYTIGAYKAQFAVVVVCILGTALATLYSTMFMQSLIDDFILPMLQGSGSGFKQLGDALLKLAGVCAIGVGCAYSYNLIMVYVTQGTMLKLRDELFCHMESLPIGYFDTHPHGDIMSTYTNDVDTLRQMLSQSIPQVINACVSIVSTFVAMIVLSIPLTCMSIAMVALLMFVVSRLGGKSASHFAQQQKDLASVNGYIEEMIQGQKVVKVFCHEAKSIEGFDALNDRLCHSADFANRYANVMMPIANNVGNISYVLCAVAGALMALSGAFGLTLGMLITFLSLNRSFSNPISQVSQQVNSIVMALAGADRVFSLLDAKPESDDGRVVLASASWEDGALKEVDRHSRTWAWKDLDSGRLTPLKGEVRLEGVDFSYDGVKTVLFGVDVFAKPGQKIAFVGSTGAGKTTITNLINRFYDVERGRIVYDGIDIGDIAKADLRRSLGMVLQDTHLFTGSVMDNIRYGRLEATDEECIAASRLAGSDGFVRRLPEGYDTRLIGDGVNLSQGQRQLLAIARAAVADPPVLVLDEATSSIDTRTEKLVQEGMDRLMSGRTVFVIAHRLSTVRNTDCIMVLERGRIIERGSHEELLERRGRYFQLYTGNDISP